MAAKNRIKLGEQVTLLYGFVGGVAAVPIAFAINVTRNWR
jgi:hypothetical protein